jgi:hypothetical protein
MKRHCKECPHIIRNQHNDMIVSFVERTGKKHKCHMIIKGKNKKLWTVDPEFECCGSINLISTCNINK